MHFFGQVLTFKVRFVFSQGSIPSSTEVKDEKTVWNRPLGLFGIFGPNFCEQDIFYRDTEDNDEKTVERSPELSAGNGGELDLLKMDFREI